MFLMYRDHNTLSLCDGWIGLNIPIVWPDVAAYLYIPHSQANAPLWQRFYCRSAEDMKWSHFNSPVTHVVAKQYIYEHIKVRKLYVTPKENHKFSTGIFKGGVIAKNSYFYHWKVAKKSWTIVCKKRDFSD